ncbi:hypothetical protein Glove_236g46 [Diversispora epigaea]|uniref:DUF659 domain-containing protein n=1 Tax=Diversispora epigaea TaxID=1348612 RepID=A0A397IJK8_9GLOM|nr:hypothetical protein Glove_236g46 [Diversispora epigaea]
MSRPRTHHLTKYIKAACIGCVEKFDKDEISKNTFTNKKPQVKNHLKNCPYFLEKIGTSSSKHPSSVGVKKNDIKSSLIHKFTKKKESKFEHLLLRITVANGFSFQWIEHPATPEFFEFLNPLLVLPKRKTLSNRILNKETSELKTLQNKKLINDEIGVVLAFDGWKNVINQHIFGLLFITFSGENLIWNALDISSERERLIELISKIKDLIEEINHLGIKLNAIVSDSATEFPEIIFLLCIAHQCQLAIGDLFKVSSIELHQNLAIHNTDQKFIKPTPIWYPIGVDLCEILLSNDWWEVIECLQDILLLYCGILNKLQCDKARPFEVLHALGYFVHFWKQYLDQDLEKELQQNYTQFMNSNIISIETDFNEISSTNEIPTSSIDNIDDLEENNTNIITTSEHWKQELKEWVRC